MTVDAIAEAPEPKEKPRKRANSGMTRRASVLSPEEQRTLQRETPKKPKRSKEHRAVGSVDKKVYTEYIKANGVAGVIAYVGDARALVHACASC